MEDEMDFDNPRGEKRRAHSPINDQSNKRNLTDNSTSQIMIPNKSYEQLIRTLDMVKPGKKSLNKQTFATFKNSILRIFVDSINEANIEFSNELIKNFEKSLESKLTTLYNDIDNNVTKQISEAMKPSKTSNYSSYKDTLGTAPNVNQITLTMLMLPHQDTQF